MAEVKNKKNVKKTRQENLDTNKVDSTKKERGNKNMVKLIGLVVQTLKNLQTANFYNIFKNILQVKLTSN